MSKRLQNNAEIQRRLRIINLPNDVLKKLTIYSFLFFVLSIFSSYDLFAQEPYQVRMAMIGNSITYGAGLPDPAKDCYPSQLDTLLRAVYGDTILIRNYGVSARTMTKNSELPIWSEPAFKNALEFVPDVCLILLGTNDSKPYRWDSLGDEFLDDYISMIDTFKFRNPNTKFIVCYPPPIWEGHPYGTTFEDKHNDSVVVNHIIPLIDSVVALTGALLIDFHSPFKDSLQYFPDKLHPNKEGSGIMAQILFDSLIDKNLFHQVETGLAYVSVFRQSPSVVPVGSNVLLQWETIFADSVFLDGIPVVENGSQNVMAEEGKVYTLTAKGAQNSSTYPLILNTTPATSVGDLNSLTIKVFPNPANDVLKLKIDPLPSTKLSFHILNSLGQEVKQIAINQRQADLNLNISDLPPGIYHYILTSGKGYWEGKFIKEK